MITAIKRQFSVQYKDWGILLALVLGAAVSGIILFRILLVLENGPDGYLALGTLISIMAAVMFAFIVSLVGLGHSFNLEISMGCTRKHFFISYYITVFASTLLSMLLIILINAAECALYRLIYRNMDAIFDFFPYLIRWGLPAVLAITVFSIFLGALMMRFGKTAFWILWAFWMFGCLGLPNITETMQEAPDSLWGRVGNAAAGLLQTVPVNAWVILGVIAGAVSIAGTWIIIRKQQVTA